MSVVSYSGITMYERCPRSFQLKYIIKHPEPKFVPTDALRRGSRLHKSAEDYVNLALEKLPKELQNKKGFFDRIISVGTAMPELEFNFTREFEPIDFDDKESGYVRGIIDLVLPQEDLLEIKEYKTGKKYDSHSDQRSLYSLAGLILFPEAKVVRTTTVYFDLKNKDETLTVERHQLDDMKWSWSRRINRTKPPQDYPMRPGYYCQWCSFSKSKGGPCPN
mgnify:CR=1 FL=1